jgi:IclR family KDG regulon transcriptional repressor
MGIFDRGQVLYVAKVDSDDPIRIISYVGKRLPAYCTALGKALLCQKNIKELKKLYPDGLKKYTPNTITDFEVLADQLKEIKQTMIATENGEVNEQSDCISVPLFKGDDILAAISVSVPSFRMTEEKTELIKSMLLETKTKIETFFREHDIDSTQLTLSN